MSINPNNFGDKGITLKVNNTLDVNEIQEVQLVVKEDDLIRDVMEKIRDEFKLDNHDYSLLYEELLLEDDKCIKYYNIRKDHLGFCYPSIEIVHGSMVRQVNVKLEDGETIALGVKKTISIGNLKKKIDNKIELSPDDQRLLYLGEILEDDKTVDEYQIAENDVINVVTRPRGGNQISAKTMDEVTKTDTRLKNQKKIELSPDEPEYRARSSETRGICVVISNENFHNADKRLGTKVDEANIKKTFQLMGYEVKVHQDVTKTKMRRIIDETKMLIRKTDRNMIVFVLSHGSENSVTMSDGKPMPFKGIWTPFSNDAFPEFAGKSKLFFFSCCLGSNYNIAVAPASKIKNDGPQSPTDLVPAMGDFFIGYSTCDSHYSFRHESKGTDYIDCLCKVVINNRDWNVYQIHQEVQTRLSEILLESKHIQMPHCESMLREHAYFYG